jgi:guanyl-specific ribonuclease Sa
MNGMKRINWLSLLLGALITLALVSSCNVWRASDKGVQGSTAADSVLSAAALNEPLATGDRIGYQKLPREAQNVIDTIRARGQFPYSKDGSVFGNREGLLPKQPRGYYQEYTVKTPKVDNRGARRIVAGKGKTGDVATSGEYYYTADHYRTFYRVVEK